MSNFNVPGPSASSSAISLGGEWRSRDQMEANKYKMSGLSVINKKRTGKGSQQKDKSRPRSTPTSQLEADFDEDTPPKSAPPGSRPRCGRVNEVEAPSPTARRSLENHLPLKKKSSGDRSNERTKQYDLGPGMTLSKSKSKVAVTISTGDGDATPPPILRRYQEAGPVNDPANKPKT